MIGRMQVGCIKIYIYLYYIHICIHIKDEELKFIVNVGLATV